MAQFVKKVVTDILNIFLLFPLPKISFHPCRFVCCLVGWVVDQQENTKTTQFPENQPEIDPVMFWCGSGIRDGSRTFFSVF